jgi:hypothetical protein
MQPTMQAKLYAEATPRVQKILDEEIGTLFEGTTDWRCRLCGTEAPTTGLAVTDDGLAVCPHDGCAGAGWSDLLPVGHVYRTTA